MKQIRPLPQEQIQTIAGNLFKLVVSEHLVIDGTLLDAAQAGARLLSEIANGEVVVGVPEPEDEAGPETG